jgi:hypothetical protein
MKFAASLGLAFLALLPVSAHAGADSDAMVKFGLIGSWAVDCHAPPSLANPFQTFVASNAAQPTRQLIVGNPSIDRLQPLYDVALLAADRLRLAYAQGGVTVTVVLIKQEGRIRPIESTTSSGETVVSGGIVQRDGRSTTWLEKCPE